MAAGKTTLIRALAAAIDPAERIATIEHDYELFLHTFPDRHQDVLAMQVREPNAEGAGAITMTTCIQDALWMNARRIIVGEVRGEELLAMLAAMNTGGDGSLCTLHADSASQAFTRMLICAESGGLRIPPESLYRVAGMAVDFVIHLERRGRHRFISQVSEVLPPADAIEPAVNQVFTPDEQNGRCVPATAPQSLPDLIDAGFDPAPFMAQSWEQVRPR
jgi:pilus assembly protein CpaF